PGLSSTAPQAGLKACRACGAGNFPNVQFEILKFEIRCRAFCATNPHLRSLILQHPPGCKPTDIVLS
ncbi:MAG: hypothetical protein IKV82_07690, partial [Akkermansia sp.]|nr:hypothetical protein [Akkermansia sp.]